MFLHRLIERTLGEAPVIAPRRASRFEPAGPGAEPYVATLKAAERETVTAAGPPAPVLEPRVVHHVQRIEPGIPRHTVSAQRPPIVPREVRASAIEPPVPPQMTQLSPRADMPPSPAATAPPVTVLVDRRTEASPLPRETIVRERIERSVETQTIERQLEHLQESRIERVERFESTIERRPSVAARPPSPADARPQSTPVLPSAPEQPSLRPAIVQPRVASPEPTPAPTIHVTIGRVEVRTSTPTAPERASKPRSREPKLGLEEYLKQRERA
jgi:hypothetical protein